MQRISHVSSGRGLAWPPSASRALAAVVAAALAGDEEEAVRWVSAEDRGDVRGEVAEDATPRPPAILSILSWTW